MNIINSFLQDLSEIANNLDDDLEMDLKNGENGYKTYKESHKATKKYTQKTILRIMRKWDRKLKKDVFRDK